MQKESLKGMVRRLAEPLVRAQGLAIWGVEVVTGGRMLVRLYVDTPVPSARGAAPVAEAATDGADIAALSATLDQCEEISRHLGLALDVEGAIDGAYVLEVSSPGLSRVFFDLGQMAAYVGDVVDVRLNEALGPQGGEPRRTWRGTLVAVDDASFTLSPAGVSEEGDVSPLGIGPVRIRWGAVRRANRVAIFHKPVKPGKGPSKKKAAVKAG